MMAEQPTCEELEQRVKELEKEVLQHRQAAENLLKNEQDKYNKLIHDSNDAIIIAQGIELKLANKAAYRMWGYQNDEEAADLKMTDVISPNDLEIMLKRSYARERGEKVPNRYEFRAMRKDGSEFLAELSVSRIIYQGQVARQGVVRDITEQRRVEEALRKSEEKYRLLADNITDAICVINLDKLGFEYASRSVESVFGYTTEEFMNINMYDLLIPDSADHAMEVLAQEIEKNKYGKAESQLLELEVLRKDGLKICIGVSARFLRDNKEHVISILCVARDISELKKAEEALKESEERMRSVVETSPAGIAIYDETGQCFVANDSIAKMVGATKERVLELNYNDIKAWKVYGILDKAKNVIKEGISKRFELIAESTFGQIVRLDCYLVPFASGQLIFMAYDITERMLVEKKLKESEEKYRLLADNVSDVIWTMDMDMNYTYISPSIANLIGFTVEEALALSPEKSMTPASYDAVIKSITEELEMHSKGQKPKDRSKVMETEIYRKDGSTVWAEIEANFIYDSNGQPEGMIGVTRDIAERKKAEEAIKKANEQLEEKVKERTTEIEEKNIAFKVLLDQRGDDRTKLEETMISNVKELLIPNINRLKNSTLSGKQQTVLNILESNLNEIISPFVSSLSSRYLKLTPTEIQVANYIKHGTSSKAIANSMGLSQRTVDTHRYNIRKKFGISGQGTNLRTYLSSLT
jgi:PAS domain S-box-containing protein